MKSFLLLLLASFSVSSTVHAQDLDLDEADAFWKSNIQAILDADIEKVMDQTSFPLTTYEDDWTEEDFRDNFELVFDEMVLADLAAQDLTDIQVVEDEDGLSYMVVIYTVIGIDEDFYESATILSFTKMDDDWKLYRIDVAG